MAGRQALGRGLSSLLSSGRHAVSLADLPVASISPNRVQPRKRFDPKTLGELAASIKEQGVATPVIVRRRPAGGYELIAGERRWRAARQAGLKTVPAVVREANDREALELALVENLQREDLNPMEEAASYAELLKDLTQDELAKRLGKDRATVANAVRLLKLPREIQDGVGAGAISAGHARAILALEAPAAQLTLFRRIVKQQLSVRQAEAAAHRSGRPDGAAARGRGGSGRSSDEDLSRALGTKVRLRRSGKRGAIVIEFYSEEELERLVALLGRLAR